MSKQKSRQLANKVSGASKPATSGALKATATAEKSAAVLEQDADGEQTSETLGVDSSAEQPKAQTATSTVTKPISSSGTKTSTATKPVSAPGAKPAATPKPVLNAPVKVVTSANKPQTRDGAKYERRQAERQMRYLAQRRARRTKILVITALSLVVIVVASFSGYFIVNAHSGKAQVAPTAIPNQEAIYDNDFPPIDNVYCDQLEGSVLHIHAVLDLYIDGKPAPLPAGVGIPVDSQSQNATCYYWLHTHDATGVIHIESPFYETFTVGQFLDVWNQGFSTLGFPSQLLLNTGWTVWLNGQPYKGSLDSVPLNAHNIITAAYDSPNVKPLKTFSWGSL